MHDGIVHINEAASTDCTRHFPGSCKVAIPKAFIMKSPFASLLLILLAVGSSKAWTLPANAPKLFQGFVAAAGIAASVTFAPLASYGADVYQFNHQYNDPKHPNCKRIVVVKQDGTAALSGTDGTPGCPDDGSGDLWRLTGEVEGNTILVDFSPKVRLSQLQWSTVTLN